MPKRPPINKASQEGPETKQVLRVHRVAARIEGRYERAFLKAVERLRDEIDPVALTVNLQQKDFRGVMRQFQAARSKDAFKPLRAITSDALMRGHEIAREDVAQVTGERE